MFATYIFPGKFCPPTKGHFEMVKKIARVVPFLNVICSVNPDKPDVWFTPEDCRKLWTSYPLPNNVAVETFESFSEKAPNPKDLVLVRGVRGEDFSEEQRIISLNKQTFGIENYFYIFSDSEFEEISATLVRRKAQELDLEFLGQIVSPMVLTKLLEKVLEIENLFLVVGKPGCGKSTFLRALTFRRDENVHINSDFFNKKLKPYMESIFPGEDLIKVLLERRNEFSNAIRKPWMALLRKSLFDARGRKNVFVEVAYGLVPEYSMHRVIGGKILHVNCQSKEENEQRVKTRGNLRHMEFFDSIPGLDETKEIAREQRLHLFCVDNSNGIENLVNMAEQFIASIEKGGAECLEKSGLRFGIE